MIAKHVFLTGERQVGKSTLMNQALLFLKQKPSGFVTQPYYIEERIKGHYMHSLVLCEENDVPISIRHKAYAEPILSSFNEFGTFVLQHSRMDESRLILMDELGVLEEGAEAFKAEVFACLDGEKRVVGIVKKADTPFLQQIRTRKDTSVLELTANNRAEIYNQLIFMLK